jgi:cytochrome c biogenesis protein CcmG/thiol:disulfide interchange protein DsbE
MRRSSEAGLPLYAEVGAAPWVAAATYDAPTEEPAPLEQEGESPAELLFRTPFPRPRLGALRNILATIAVGAIIVGLVWFFDTPGNAATSQTITLTAAASGPPPRVGKEAPNFQVQGLDGKTLQLSDFRGRPVWITFWATWCPPCRAENPDIQEVYAANQGQGLVVLALSIGEDAGTVRGYVQRTGLTYAIGLDQTTEIAARYRIVGIPTHFFVDKNGIIRELRIGSMSKKTMEKNVKEIMSSNTAVPGQ